MIRRIELHNFMSHCHTTIDLSEGLTVLVGPNNCGKSAVVTALKILATNDNSTFVKRHGEKHCRVVLHISDEIGVEHVIEWGRKSSPYYVIDDERFDRLKTAGIPQKLIAMLRMPMVEGEGATFDLHFGEQKSPVFLIDRPASQVGQFFASSSDAAYLLAMQRIHSRRVSDARSEVAHIDARIEVMNREIESLSICDSIERNVTTVERTFQNLSKQNTLALELKRSTDRIEGQRRLVSLTTASEGTRDAANASPNDRCFRSRSNTFGMARLRRLD
ncbi:MAG: AAA family ATPase [Pirellulaceae bacterium]